MSPYLVSPYLEEQKPLDIVLHYDKRHIITEVKSNCNLNNGNMSVKAIMDT